MEAEKCTGEAYKTLFVARLHYDIGYKGCSPKVIRPTVLK
jgi:hypothetical protein